MDCNPDPEENLQLNAPNRPNPELRLAKSNGMDGFYDQQVPYMVPPVSDQLQSYCFYKLDSRGGGGGGAGGGRRRAGRGHKGVGICRDFICFVATVGRLLSLQAQASKMSLPFSDLDKASFCF